MARRTAVYPEGDALSDFWDNLIPLKGSLSGEQFAGWTPRESDLGGLGCRVLADRRIPVSGDVTLSADVYVPRKAGRYPAVISFAAYSSELHTAGVPTGTNEIGSPPVFTDRGYCPVIVMRRGMGRSGGKQVIFFDPQDVDDHERCIAWAAEQPWCNGEVVLFGTSYYGMTQPLVAVRRPPALKAFFANELCTDYFRHLVQFGGVFGLYFMNVWMGANFNEAAYQKRVSPLARALLSQLLNSPLKPLLTRIVMRRVDAMFVQFMRNTPVKEVREWYASWMLDGKTRETASIPSGPSQELGQIEIPFVAVQNLGYLNLHQYGSYELFEKARTPANKKWLILGPPRFELPVYSWQLEAIAFFDHVLRGADNGYAEQPAVRYWLEGEARFVGATGFPVPESKRTRWHLTSKGADAAMHELTPSAPEGGSNSWAAVPTGLPILGGFDEVANQTLRYEVQIEEALELAGPVSAHLEFSCNEIDSYVMARLGRVDKGGAYHLLSLGVVSPARRRLDLARSTACEIAIDTGVREPLTPGKSVTLAFSLTPAPTKLNPGDKLRLEIASRTDLLISGPSRGFAQFDMPVPPYFSRNTLHYGKDSYIEVSRVAR